MSAFLYGFFVAFHIAEASANCMKFKHTEEREMNQKHSLTEGNILKSLLTFAIPVLFSLLLQALYGGAGAVFIVSYNVLGAVFRGIGVQRHHCLP